jgi:hypothetical protein
VVSSFVGAFLGSPPSTNPDLPGGSELDPKTHVEKVKENVSKSRAPTTIGRLLSTVLPALIGISQSVSEQPKQPSTRGVNLKD